MIVLGLLCVAVLALVLSAPQREHTPAPLLLALRRIDERRKASRKRWT